MTIRNHAQGFIDFQVIYADIFIIADRHNIF